MTSIVQKVLFFYSIKETLKNNELSSLTSYYKQPHVGNVKLTKLTQLETSYTLFCFYDIIILTETWLYSDYHNSELGLSNYCIFRLDRNPKNSNFL